MRLSIALGVGLISFSSAFAASQADRNACDKASTDPEGIRACTNIIDSRSGGKYFVPLPLAPQQEKLHATIQMSGIGLARDPILN